MYSEKSHSRSSIAEQSRGQYLVTLQVSREGSICLLYKWADAAFWFCIAAEPTLLIQKHIGRNWCNTEHLEM